MRQKQNVFADLGFDFEEAENLKIRADLMLDLRKFIEKKKFLQKEAAKFFSETQPRISNLINGHIERFSVDKLIAMLHKAGVRVHVETEVIKKAA
jgi:predicted XRE-type DNA-binding protein